MCAFSQMTAGASTTCVLITVTLFLSSGTIGCRHRQLLSRQSRGISAILKKVESKHQDCHIISKGKVIRMFSHGPISGRRRVFVYMSEIAITLETIVSIEH